MIESLRKRTRLPLDTHLMIIQPERYIEDFVHAGSDVVEAFTYYAHWEKLRVIGREALLEPMNRAALRLARFNANLGVVDKRFFQGLPSPAAAATSSNPTAS